MTGIGLALFGVMIILALANVVLLHLAASYATRTRRVPFPLDVLAGMLEVYGAFWTGRLKDESARRTVLLQYGCLLLMTLVLATFIYVAV